MVEDWELMEGWVVAAAGKFFGRSRSHNHGSTTAQLTLELVPSQIKEPCHSCWRIWCTCREDSRTAWATPFAKAATTGAETLTGACAASSSKASTAGAAGSKGPSLGAVATIRAGVTSSSSQAQLFYVLSFPLRYLKTNPKTAQS